VGHVGGDVNPNEMDAMCTLHMSQWLMAASVDTQIQPLIDTANPAIN
jgi:hypothetical protein